MIDRVEIYEKEHHGFITITCRVLLVETLTRAGDYK